MNNKNNNVRNIYMRNSKNLNKNQNNNNYMTEKNNIIFIKNNNLIKSHNSRENSKSIKNGRKKINYKKIYCNENKKKMIQENSLILENISKTNAVNIQNINLINSMNNITVYDSSLENGKKDCIRKPIDAFNSDKIFTSSQISIDYNNVKNNPTNKNNNILVNKKRKILGEYPTLNEIAGNESLKNDKNSSMSKKINFNDFKNQNLSHTLKNFKSFNNNNTFNKGNNYSTFNKKDNNNDNMEVLNNNEMFQGNLSAINNRNNSTNKSSFKENNTNKTEFSLFNTCSNFTNSMGEEDMNELNSKMLLIEKMNNKHNIINVNKLNQFKINVSNLKSNNDNSNKYSNNRSNFSNIQTSPNSSNIFHLQSNKSSINRNKNDREYLNKLKMNNTKEKLHRTKSKDSLKIIKKQNIKKIKIVKDDKKTKSEEKSLKNNKDNKNKKVIHNKEIAKRIKKFSSFLNENSKINNKNYKNINIARRLGHEYIKDINNNYENNTFAFNESAKFFYLNLNSDSNTQSLNVNDKRTKKNAEYPNRIKYYNLIQQKNEKNSDITVDKEKTIDNNKFEAKFETDTHEKIEVNKKIIQKNKCSNKILLNPMKKKSASSISGNENKSINLYTKKIQQESSIYNTEQTNSFSKNLDKYNCFSLSNFKEREEKKEVFQFDKIDENRRKKSAPKKNIGKTIYNKKQLFCYLKKGKSKLEHKVTSPDFKDKQLSLRELTCDFSQNNNNIFDDESSFNYNGKKTEVAFKSPSNAIYKKPAKNTNSNHNLSIVNLKKQYHNKLSLYTNKVLTHENRISYSKNSKPKKQFNIKLNKFITKFGYNNDNNNNDKINNINYINANSINYNDEIIPKTKESIFFNSINTYKTLKNDLSSISNNETIKVKELIINSEQFSFKKVNKKIKTKNCFYKKYYCYFIDQKYIKEECFITKMRLNKNNFTIYNIPNKKICYCSKKRKIFVKSIPKIEICYYKKDLIIANKNDISNNKKIKSNRKNKIINEYGYINKKEVENIDKYNFQYSFTSLNSNEHNISENSNNYFEISFGKKSNISSNNEYIINKMNNNDKFKVFEENKPNEIIENGNIFLNNNIEISPSKKYLNRINYNNNNNDIINLKKTEEGLKLLQKIADNRISSISNKMKSKNKPNNFNKNIINENEDKYKINDGKVQLELKNYNILVNNGNKIKNDFIELLNMLTINNYDIILNNISKLILNNNMITINNISELSTYQNIFAEVIISKAIAEEKYIKLYAKICKDLFISLMTIIDNYNDDMDVFDKITKDKSLKVILKTGILEKLEKLDLGGAPSFGISTKNLTKEPFYYNIKLKYIGIINFIGELLEVKLISLKSGFEILDLLYKRYIKGNNALNMIAFNDLNLEGIEILLRRIKIIAYEKKNPEHIQRYNKYIKNYLNNIFKIRIKKNDLSKYLYYRLYNIINNQKNEEEIKKKLSVKTFTTFNNNDNIIQLNIDKNDYVIYNNNIDNKNNSFILENKYNMKKAGTANDKSPMIEIKSNFMIEIIKRDIKNLLFNSNINEIKTDIVKEINTKLNEEINIKKTIDIWEIFYYYIEVCIDTINNEENVNIVTEYIRNFINNFTIDIPNERWEMLHYKLISLFLNVNDICTDNIYMFQIMGNLLFLLIKNKLFYIKDLNNFLNKDNQIIKDIAKVVKYTIIFADKDAKKYHNDFKQTKLFIGNDNFYNIVTLPLKQKYFDLDKYNVY